MHETTDSTEALVNSGPKILVVDDSATQIELLRFLLEKANYTVAAATDGSEALALIKCERFDLVISDIVMPVMNGYELCSHIKQNPEYQDTAVMLLTRLADVEDIIVGLEAEADYYVTKPYSEKFLLSRVNLLLTHTAGRRIGDIDKHLSVTLAGKSYTVSAERAQILNFLVSTYENAIQRNRELTEAQQSLRNSNHLLAEQTAKAQEAEENYLKVLQNNPDAVVVLNREKEACFLNVAARDMLGTDSEIERIVATLSLTIGVIEEVDIEVHDQQKIVVELRVAETSWAGQNAYIATLRDVSVRRKAERRIQEQQQQLYEANQRLKEMALLDVMTGLHNFRSFKERLEVELARSRRYQEPLSMLLLDVDHFKSFNDEFGHPAGDELLASVAMVLREHVRITDFPARYGGEEFVILLPNTDEVGAIDLAERLREAMEKADWKSRITTASFGVATMSDKVPDGATLLAAADRAMYQSKFGGRNRVTHFQDLEGL